MNTSPNCYECKYQGPVPGSVHSSCGHPAVSQLATNPLAKIMAMFAGVHRIEPINAAPVAPIKVIGNQAGIARGWFNWPWNFDPVWLQECDGFEPKQQPATI